MSYILEVIFSSHVNEMGSSDDITKIFKHFNTIDDCHEMFYTYLCENKQDVAFVCDVIHDILCYTNEQEEKSNSKLTEYKEVIPCNWIDFCKVSVEITRCALTSTMEAK